MGWYSIKFLQISNDNNFTFFLQIYCHNCSSVTGYLFFNVRNTSYQSFAGACSSNITSLPIPFLLVCLVWGAGQIIFSGSITELQHFTRQPKNNFSKNLFGINQQIVLAGNMQIYMVDLVEKYIFKKVIFPAYFACQGLNQDPNVWLDGTRPPPRYISKYITI